MAISYVNVVVNEITELFPQKLTVLSAKSPCHVSQCFDSGDLKMVLQDGHYCGSSMVFD
jgi:hypothetical protein